MQGLGTVVTPPPLQRVGWHGLFELSVTKQDSWKTRVIAFGKREFHEARALKAVLVPALWREWAGVASAPRACRSWIVEDAQGWVRSVGLCLPEGSKRSVAAAEAAEDRAHCLWTSGLKELGFLRPRGRRRMGSPLVMLWPPGGAGLQGTPIARTHPVASARWICRNGPDSMGSRAGIDRDGVPWRAAGDVSGERLE